MIALLAFAALAFGAVEAWSEMVVVTLAGGMLACLLLKQVLRPTQPLVWSWAYVPVGLFILLAVVQLIPLPVGIVRLLSPHTAEVKTSLLCDLPGAAGGPQSMTLSFYPAATKHDLRLVLAVAAVFFVTLNVFGRPEQIRRLLAGIVVVGAGIALLALAQVVTGARGVYWTVPSPYGKATAGSFLNYSHFSQFMNLSIGAAVALLIVGLRDGLRHGHTSFRDMVEHLTSPSARTVWWLAAAVVLGAATVFLSLSRAGAIALLIAATFTAVVVAAKRALSGRGWFMAMLAVGAFVCVLYVGFDAVYRRLATLQDFHHGYGSRWQIVKDVAVAWTKFPLLGTGLGTHAVVYPMFDRSTIAALATHAENEYAQAAEETGILGLAALVAFAVLIWRDYARSVRRLNTPIRLASLGLGFGLLAVLVHSFTDFGQHLPANACLTAVFCGLLVTLARRPDAAEDAASPPAGPRRFQPVAVVALVAVAGAWGWAAVTANDARAAESHWARAVKAEKRLVESDWLGTNEDYASLISQAAAAVQCQPDDAKYRHWLNVYRWNSISRVTDPDTGAVILTPRTRQFTGRIVQEFNEARALCPTFGPTYCVLGQLEKHVLHRPEGVAHIRTGYALAPHDGTTCFVAGHLDAQEGKIDESLAKFRRMLKLRPSMFADAAAVYVHEVNRPDLALSLAGDDVSCLLHLVKVLGDPGGLPGPRQDVLSKAIAALKAQCERKGTPAGTLAAAAPLCKRTRDYDAAIAYYRRALAVQYEQVHWRLDLARTLAEAGKVPEAMHEARVCLRLRPEMEPARALLADLSVRPGPTAQ